MVTTLDPAVWTAEAILAWYRMRWQVEVAIKRWKSLLKAGQLRTKPEGTLASLWLHGKEAGEDAGAPRGTSGNDEGASHF